MKITKPSDMKGDLLKFEEAVEKFEEKFKLEGKNQNYYHLVISGEYNRVVCDKIQLLYTKAGWKDVKCRTSSENGERPGLTGLMLYS